MNFGADTHLGAGVMNTFVFPLPTLLKCSLGLLLAVQLSGKAHEDSDYTVSCCCSDIVSTVTIFGIAIPSGCCCSLSSNSHGRHMVCALIGTSHKVAAYNHIGSL